MNVIQSFICSVRRSLGVPGPCRILLARSSPRFGTAHLRLEVYLIEWCERVMERGKAVSTSLNSRTKMNKNEQYRRCAV